MNNERIQKALDKQIYIVTKESRFIRIFRNPFKPIYRRIVEFIAKNFKILLRLNVKTFWGDKLQIILPERSSSYMLKFGFWEEDVTMLLIQHLKSGGIFFDVGAHMGYFSLLGSSLVGSTGEVHSFEPAHWAFDSLKHNVRHKNNCTLNKVAAFIEKKTLTFNDYGPLDSLYNSFFKINDEESITKELKLKTYDVKTISLDEYANTKNIIPDVVKIDAETAEYNILKGMENIINMKKTIFIFEVGGFSREEDSSQEAVSYLIDKGYNPYEVKDGNIVAYAPKKEDYYKNLLFIPCQKQ